MQTIDEIRIESDEGGWYLTIFPDDETPDESTHAIRYRIGLPDQIKAEVDRTIGRWLAEGEAVRAIRGMPPSTDVWTGDGYDKGDPKHPMWHDTMSTAYDNQEGK